MRFSRNFFIGKFCIGKISSKTAASSRTSHWCRISPSAAIFPAMISPGFLQSRLLVSSHPRRSITIDASSYSRRSLHPCRDIGISSPPSSSRRHQHLQSPHLPSTSACASSTLYPPSLVYPLWSLILFGVDPSPATSVASVPTPSTGIG